jgi:hypothetical protein
MQRRTRASGLRDEVREESRGFAEEVYTKKCSRVDLPQERPEEGKA